MKKILYFYPHNFEEPTDGIHTRIVTILEYFKYRQFKVDFVCFEDKTVKDPYIIRHGLAKNFYTVPQAEPTQTIAKSWLGRKMNSASNKMNTAMQKGNNYFRGHRLPNLVTPALSGKIAELIAGNSYYALLVTYQYYADIALEFDKRNIGIKKIIDPTDFLTLQYYYNHKKLTYRDVGSIFGTELQRFSYFDDIIYISNDELFTFSGFLPKAKHHFIPQYFKRNELHFLKTNLQYDILFVGSKNPYNIEGVRWFLEEVLPLLNPAIRIGIAGNICSKITKVYPNVRMLGFVENIHVLYQATKCTICPLKRGSGMKIKVVESLSYSVPVVSTNKGIDGFINKNTGNGIMIENEAAGFAEAIHELLSNDVLYQQQCLAANQTFEKTFSYDVNFKKLDDIFNTLNLTAS